MPLVDRLPYAPWTERGAVVDGQFRWRLGVRSLDLANWIEFGPDADGPDGWIAQKVMLNERHPERVFVALEDSEAEGSEVAEALVAHLATHHPERHRMLDPGLHPLDAAARLVPEDLVMMVEREGQMVFGAGSVCFPNRWDLRSKLGQTMADVHAPVAQLNEQLEAAVGRFLDRLTPERSFWRLGWGLIDVPDGYTPPDDSGPIRPVRTSADDLFVRVERETLRRFSESRCVLFSIRTYVAPIETVAADPASRAALAAAVAAMSPDVREYKDLADLGDAVAAWAR